MRARAHACLHAYVWVGVSVEVGTHTHGKYFFDLCSTILVPPLRSVPQRRRSIKHATLTPERSQWYMSSPTTKLATHVVAMSVSLY